MVKCVQETVDVGEGGFKLKWALAEQDNEGKMQVVLLRYAGVMLYLIDLNPSCPNALSPLER